MFVFTLQGPTGDGNLLMESWEIPREMYLHMRSCVEGEPVATSLMSPQGELISQRFTE